MAKETINIKPGLLASIQIGISVINHNENKKGPENLFSNVDSRIVSIISEIIGNSLSKQQIAFIASNRTVCFRWKERIEL